MPQTRDRACPAHHAWDEAWAAHTWASPSSMAAYNSEDSESPCRSTPDLGPFRLDWIQLPAIIAFNPRQSRGAQERVVSSSRPWQYMLFASCECRFVLVLWKTFPKVRQPITCRRNALNVMSGTRIGSSDWCCGSLLPRGAGGYYPVHGSL